MSIVKNKTYLIRRKGSAGTNGYLNIYGSSYTGDTQNVKLWQKVSTDNMQKWQFNDDPTTGAFLCTLCDLSRAINIYNASSDPRCTIWKTAGNANDGRVKIEEDGNTGYYYIFLPYHNLYLTATSTANATQVKWAAKVPGAESQLWKFEADPTMGGNVGNYLVYPCRTVNISQNYNGTLSHAVCSSGTPADYPIDEKGYDTARDYIYCPCDEMVVRRVYGVGGNGTNTIWLRSTSRVKMPCGENYVVMMVTHPEDDDLASISVNDTFTRGQAMFREGADGNATGNHFHISLGLGDISGNGWVQNNNGAWVINTTEGSIKPEQGFYIDDFFSNIMDKAQITFSNLPSGASQR